MQTDLVLTNGVVYTNFIQVHMHACIHDAHTHMHTHNTHTHNMHTHTYTPTHPHTHIHIHTYTADSSCRNLSCIEASPQVHSSLEEGALDNNFMKKASSYDVQVKQKKMDFNATRKQMVRAYFPSFYFSFQSSVDPQLNPQAAIITSKQMTISSISWCLHVHLFLQCHHVHVTVESCHYTLCDVTTDCVMSLYTLCDVLQIV